MVKNKIRSILAALVFYHPVINGVPLNTPPTGTNRAICTLVALRTGAAFVVQPIERFITRQCLAASPVGLIHLVMVLIGPVYGVKIIDHKHYVWSQWTLKEKLLQESLYIHLVYTIWIIWIRSKHNPPLQWITDGGVLSAVVDFGTCIIAFKSVVLGTPVMSEDGVEVSNFSYHSMCLSFIY